MQSIEKEQMISFEVSLGELAVKRKIEAKTKIATLRLPLLNKPQSAPKFASVSELGGRQASDKKDTEKQTRAIFEASVRALEGEQGKKEDK